MDTLWTFLILACRSSTEMAVEWWKLEILVLQSWWMVRAVFIPKRPARKYWANPPPIIQLSQPKMTYSLFLCCFGYNLSSCHGSFPGFHLILFTIIITGIVNFKWAVSVSNQFWGADRLCMQAKRKTNYPTRLSCSTRAAIAGDIPSQ